METATANSVKTSIHEVDKPTHVSELNNKAKEQIEQILKDKGVSANPNTGLTPVNEQPVLSEGVVKAAGATNVGHEKFSIGEDAEIIQKDVGRNLGGFFKKYLTGGHTEKLTDARGWIGNRIHNIKTRIRSQKGNQAVKMDEVE